MSIVQRRSNRPRASGMDHTGGTVKRLRLAVATVHRPSHTAHNIVCLGLTILLAGCAATGRTSQPHQAAPGATTTDQASLEPATLVAHRDINTENAPSMLPQHFYVNRRLVHIRRPGWLHGGDARRLDVVVSGDEGRTWQPAGSFEPGRSLVAYDAPSDGDYPVRITRGGDGPGSPALVCERMYHVDTTMPDGELSIHPALDQDAVRAGQELTLAWSAADRLLIDRPVQVSACGDDDQWRVVQTDLPSQGELAYTVPDDGAGDSIQFRIEVLDRAGNIGMACGPALAILPETRADACVEEDAVAAMLGEDGSPAHAHGGDESDDMSIGTEADAELVREWTLAPALEQQPSAGEVAPPDESALAPLSGEDGATTAQAPGVEQDRREDSGLPPVVHTGWHGQPWTRRVSPRETVREANRGRRPRRRVQGQASSLGRGEEPDPLEPSAVDVGPRDIVLAPEVVGYLHVPTLDVSPQIEPLVPTLPALDGLFVSNRVNDLDRISASQRPWQVLRAAAERAVASVWSLPRPQLLSGLARLMNTPQPADTDLPIVPDVSAHGLLVVESPENDPAAWDDEPPAE